jgi:protein tyrosine phosphatase (PTP) superfamily phosphohydrolase (DUF442 family)
MNRFHLTATALLTAALSFASTAAAQQEGANLQPGQLGSTRNVHAFGNSLLCGQPSVEDFAVAKGRGIEVVITLRESGEIDWDEAAVVKQLGMEFHSLGFGGPDSLTVEIFERSLPLLAAADRKPVMLHCASANRVGAVWLAHRVLNDGIAVELARQEAKTVGLRSEAYEQKALQFIQSRAGN